MSIGERARVPDALLHRRAIEFVVAGNKDDRHRLGDVGRQPRDARTDAPCHKITGANEDIGTVGPGLRKGSAELEMQI
ncbi:hypothetical protein AJ87_26715 [Rhizobium yanglingense]|nr:hypothetical protein AJ87_26715 [Rhizobium yanglingense]